MSDLNLVFSRLMLKRMHAEVKTYFPSTNLIKDAWVWNSRRHWEFHGPEKFYWSGRADNAYHARYKGWSAWLQHKGVPGYADA
jgi:hypothetical protein